MNELKTADLVVVTDEKTGVATINNYEQLKALMEEGLKYYEDFKCEKGDIDLATQNKKELEQMKKKLESKKKEVEAAYMAPYVDVMNKLEELIKMFKAPYKATSEFISQGTVQIKLCNR